MSFHKLQSRFSKLTHCRHWKSSLELLRYNNVNYILHYYLSLRSTYGAFLTWLYSCTLLDSKKLFAVAWYVTIINLISMNWQHFLHKTINTGAFHDCMLSLLVHPPYILDCVARHSSNTIFTFTNNAMFVGWITGNNESEDTRESDNLFEPCKSNNLAFNVSKTKDLIVDFRKGKPGIHEPIIIDIGESTTLRSAACKSLKICHSVQSKWKLIYASIFQEDWINSVSWQIFSLTSARVQWRAYWLVASQPYLATNAQESRCQEPMMLNLKQVLTIPSS